MKWDFIFWIFFALGQICFLLKRVALAVRSPMNPMTSRWQYVKLNWDILVVRSALEVVFVFVPYRHIPIDQLMSGFAWHIPFHIPQDSLAFTWLLGYMSDSTTDWIAMQEKIFGIPIPVWVKETIPHYPQLRIVVAQLSIDKNTE